METLHNADAVQANQADLQYTMTATLRDENGIVKQVEQVHNTVTQVGKNMIADRLLAAPTLGVPTHMGIGTGTATATALGLELTRNALTSKTRSTNVVTMQGDYAAGTGTGAITEAGIFDAAAAGNTLLTTGFAVINKAASDTLQIVWTLTIS